MAEHRFKLGQTVKIAVAPHLRDMVRDELVEIVKAMPSYGTSLRYQVKSLRTGTQRVVEEHDLEAVGDRGGE